MTAFDIYSAIGGVDEDMLEETEAPLRRKININRVAAIAACLAVAAAGIFFSQREAHLMIEGDAPLPEIDADIVTTTNISDTETSADVTEASTASETTADSSDDVTEASIITESTADSINTGTEYTEDKALNSSDYILNVNFTPVYENAGFMDVSATGAVTSYENLQDFINSYSDISFVGYEITAQYSPEEAFEKTGDGIFKRSTTLYQAHIYYDYLHDTPVDMTLYLAKAGSPDRQIRDDPPYAVGQKIISALSGFDYTSCVAIPELVYYVYNVNGVDLAYHVRFDKIVLTSDAFADLDMELLDGENSVITTTDNNPVKFTQKSTVEDLTRFIKQDWEARGYDFFDVPNFDCNAQPKKNTYYDDEPVVE